MALRSFIPGRTFVYQLLHVNLFRQYVAFARYLWLVKLKNGLRTMQSEAASKETVAHNLKSITNLTVDRSLLLIRPLTSIRQVNRDSKILTIGPRTEGEILNLLAHGFKSKNIQGLDLITYSPWVKIGDMHAMPFADNAFDICILGWVLAYSNDKRKAAQEIIRTVKDHGIVAVGAAYSPLDNQSLVAKVGYLPGSEERLLCVQDMLKWFEPHVDEIFFRQDVNDRNRDIEFNMAVIFSIKK